MTSILTLVVYNFEKPCDREWRRWKHDGLLEVAETTDTADERGELSRSRRPKGLLDHLVEVGFIHDSTEPAPGSVFHKFLGVF